MDLKHMKRISVIWGAFLIILVVLLTIVGIVYKNKSSDYKNLEEQLVAGAKKYVDANFLYPENNSSTRVTYEEMKRDGFVEELKKDNDVCTGYVIVKSNGTAFQYKGYVLCPNYKTKGYN